MKRTLMGMLIFSMALAALWGVALADYSRDNFERAVDLKRFRKGNLEWDTQELISSGMTALHQEHLQILEEIAQLKEAVKRLEAKQ